MMFNATKLIKEAFDQAGVKSNIKEADKYSLVEGGFSGHNFQGIGIVFASTDEGNDVTVRTDEFAKYPKNKMPTGLVLINILNQKYRYGKFFMNTNTGGVCVQYDFPSSIDKKDIGAVAIETAIRLTNLLDDAYPEIMKSIWS